MVPNELSNYIINLDKIEQRMIDDNLNSKTVEEYLDKQLYYLDCTRIAKGLRLMQTIGYPYRKEITSYFYALEHNNISNKQEWIDKLLDRHRANLKYEEDNPPIWYGSKKDRAKFEREYGKLPRRKKAVQQTIPGMGKELSNKERLKKLSATFGSLTFKIKLPKT